MSYRRVVNHKQSKEEKNPAMILNALAAITSGGIQSSYRLRIPGRKNILERNQLV
jgi:hypothetical protein